MEFTTQKKGYIRTFKKQSSGIIENLYFWRECNFVLDFHWKAVVLVSRLPFTIDNKSNAPGIPWNLRIHNKLAHPNVSLSFAIPFTKFQNFNYNSLAIILRNATECIDHKNKAILKQRPFLDISIWDFLIASEICLYDALRLEWQTELELTTLRTTIRYSANWAAMTNCIWKDWETYYIKKYHVVLVKLCYLTSSSRLILDNPNYRELFAYSHFFSCEMIYARDNIFLVCLKFRETLTDRENEKGIDRLTFEISNSSISYQSADSIARIHKNNGNEVAEVSHLRKIASET
jgi:hypothetical protein